MFYEAPVRQVEAKVMSDELAVYFKKGLEIPGRKEVAEKYFLLGK
jgi:hypothetical protein